MATETPQFSPQLLTLKEFSFATRLSAATIHRLIKAGKLPCIQPSGKGGKLLFPINALDLVSTPSTTVTNVPAIDQRVHGERLSGPSPKWERNFGCPKQN